MIINDNNTMVPSGEFLIDLENSGSSGIIETNEKLCDSSDIFGSAGILGSSGVYSSSDILEKEPRQVSTILLDDGLIDINVVNNIINEYLGISLYFRERLKFLFKPSYKIKEKYKEMLPFIFRYFMVNLDDTNFIYKEYKSLQHSFWKRFRFLFIG